jgi:hypothetical protein
MAPPDTFAGLFNIDAVGDFDGRHVSGGAEPLADRLSQADRDDGHVILEFNTLGPTLVDHGLARDAKVFGEVMYA